MSRYTVNGAPWAIGKDVSDCKSSAEVMHKAGLDFIVDKCDLMARMPFGINRNNSVNELAKVAFEYAKQFTQGNTANQIESLLLDL